MTSTALEKKIAKQRQAAPLELPKARLCADVVLSVLKGANEFEDALSKLKTGLGENWSHVTAFQFMSGRQARLSAECARPEEQSPMLLAHEIAKLFCDHVSGGNLSFHALRAMALAHTAK